MKKTLAVSVVTVLLLVLAMPACALEGVELSMSSEAEVPTALDEAWTTISTYNIHSEPPIDEPSVAMYFELSSTITHPYTDSIYVSDTRTTVHGYKLEVTGTQTSRSWRFYEGTMLIDQGTDSVSKTYKNAHYEVAWLGRGNYDIWQHRETLRVDLPVKTTVYANTVRFADYPKDIAVNFFGVISSKAWYMYNGQKLYDVNGEHTYRENWYEEGSVRLSLEHGADWSVVGDKATFSVHGRHHISDITGAFSTPHGTLLDKTYPIAIPDLLIPIALVLLGGIILTGGLLVWRRGTK